MSDMMTTAPGGGDAPALPTVTTSTPADNSPISARDAARALSQARWEKRKEQSPSQINQAGREHMAGGPVETPRADALEAKLANEELAETPSDDQPKADPVEATEQQPDPALPPIEPPRSWTKEEQERFKGYPRELQAYLSEREQQRDRAVRQSQNDAAEKLKTLSAKETAAEEARKQYESALPQVLHQLQEMQAGAFADIRSQSDVDRLAQEDPFRYLQWDAHQKKVAAVQREMAQAQERQTKEWQSKWAEFADREDKLTAERIPELADPAQRTKLQEGAISYLKDTGFSDTDLGQLWNGQSSLSLRDHRVQGLIRDAVKYREGQEAAKRAVTSKPLPPVQKPGVAAPRGAAQSEVVKTLSAKLDKTGSLKDAAALLSARRAAQR